MSYCTPRIIARGVVMAASISLLCGRAPAADAADQVVKIHIDVATVVGRISDNFIGFGYETSAVAQPHFFSADNARMIRLYRNLGNHGLIRIGGNISDHTQFVHDGTAAAKSEREVTIINQANLNDLGAFVRAVGWQVMWGLNLGTGNEDQAVDEAVAVDKALGPSLQSFEIGNEVDLMPRFAKDYNAYHAAFAAYKAAIRAQLPRAVFSGPDVAGNMGFVEKFVAAESADMKLVTHHYYRAGATDRRATMEFILARDAGLDARLQKLQSLCAEYHLDYRINEVNSFFGGGKRGVSDTFGSALWCLDDLLDLATHGCSGVNMETDVNQHAFISFYSPIVHDATGVCSARPEYYGMLAFAIAGRGELLQTTVDNGNINLTAYAVRQDDGTARLIAVNKDLLHDAAIECSMPPGCHSAEAYRLSAPSVDATTGVSFAGSTVADDGAFTPAAPEAAPVNFNIARITVPHASALVLKLKHD